eukprot:SAG31_NODE_707_length_12684_cov_16.884863_7_plen_44_part_00
MLHFLTSCRLLLCSLVVIPAGHVNHSGRQGSVRRGWPLKASAS